MQELYDYLAGVLMSLFFAYFPKVNTWFLALDGKFKRLVLFGFTVVVAGGYFGLSCTPFAAQLGITTACTSEAASNAVLILVKMLIASQVTYVALPSSVK
jgi:hypothetical protein